MLSHFVEAAIAAGYAVAGGSIMVGGILQSQWKLPGTKPRTLTAVAAGLALFNLSTIHVLLAFGSTAEALRPFRRANHFVLFTGVTLMALTWGTAVYRWSREQYLIESAHRRLKERYVRRDADDSKGTR